MSTKNNSGYCEECHVKLKPNETIACNQCEEKMQGAFFAGANLIPMKYTLDKIIRCKITLEWSTGEKREYTTNNMDSFVFKVKHPRYGEWIEVTTLDAEDKTS